MSNLRLIYIDKLRHGTHTLDFEILRSNIIIHLIYFLYVRKVNILQYKEKHILNQNKKSQMVEGILLEISYLMEYYC